MVRTGQYLPSFRNLQSTFQNTHISNPRQGIRPCLDPQSLSVCQADRNCEYRSGANRSCAIQNSAKTNGAQLVPGCETLSIFVLFQQNPQEYAILSKRYGIINHLSIRYTLVTLPLGILFMRFPTSPMQQAKQQQLFSSLLSQSQADQSIAKGSRTYP